MALSTTVFAPTVRMVQPAFIYNNTGGARVYFSFSSFNDIDDIIGLRYSVIDPNKKSTYGSNSMVNVEENDKEDKIFVDMESIEPIEPDSTTEYYFTIDFDKLNTLTLNQYYQIQIELKEKEEEVDGVVVVWWSAPSQATLIRPIPSYTFEIDGLSDEEEIESGDLKEIKGRIEYADGSTKEYLAKYCIDIYDTNSTPNLLYTTNWIGNVNGLSFVSKIKYDFMESQSYKLSFKGQTINGHLIEGEYSITISGYEEVAEWTDFIVDRGQEFYIDTNSGSVYIKFIAEPFEGDIIVQRSNSETGFRTWENILKIKIEEEGALEDGVAIYDYLVDGSFHIYQYRFLKVIENEVVAITKDIYQIESVYEDIFLSNTDKQLAVKYNPNISGFKWVVQESVTNALGGRFPLIRRNGETKYRQFTLSGTLYFDPLALSEATFDSRNSSMSPFLPDEDSTLFLGLDEVDNPLWAAAAAWSNRSMESKIAFYEQKFKEAAMEFLTDGKPKLFRSPTEGMMLVMLTNISFTPNKQLGRRIVDFSATATEFAEVNLENFIRYGIAPDIAYTYYVIEATGIVESDLEVTPYISEGQLLSQVNINGQIINAQADGERFLRVVQRTVRL